MSNSTPTRVPDAATPGHSFVVRSAGSAVRPSRTASALVGARRVLLVDPWGERRATLQRIATPLGVLVHHASSSAEAVGYALKHRYDALVIEPSAAEEDPRTLVEQLVALQEFCAVLLSGSWPTFGAGFALDGRLLGSLDTPWDDEQVAACISAALEMSLAWRDPKSLIADSGGDSQRVLFVGSSDDRGLLQAQLDGVQHEWAPSLAAAAAYLSEAVPDAIFTELSLPDACGLDAVRKLRKLMPQTPVVVFSDPLSDPMCDQALQAGAQDVLVKTHVDLARTRRALRFAVQRQRAQASLHHGALHDELTHLAKRTLLQQRVANALARCRRIGNTFALVYVDLDHFKWINDTHGHHVGDAVLVAVSDRLRAAVREYDTVARLGGDEFAILLDTLDDPAEAEAVAQRVLSSLSRPIEIARRELQVTASLGVSVFPEGGSEVDDLLRHADQAMYCAKRAGRNTYSLAPTVKDQPLSRPSSIRPPSLRCATGR